MAPNIPAHQTPSFTTPIPQPNYGDGGAFSVILATPIAASPAQCLEIMLDPSKYPSWNKWIPRCVVHSSPASTPAVISTLPASLRHLAYHPETLFPGTEFHFEVHMNPASSSFQRTDLVVSVVEEFTVAGEEGAAGKERKGIRVSWKTLGDPWYLRAERTQEFVEDVEGTGCEYRSYETFYGPLTFAVKTFVGGQLMNGLALWMEGLKGAAEEKAKMNGNKFGQS